MTTRQLDPDAFPSIDGSSLATYAAICRALVRLPGGSARQRTTALEAYGLTDEAWEQIQRGWSARIAADPSVRTAFRDLYIGLADPDEPVDRPELEPSTHEGAQE